MASRAPASSRCSRESRQTWGPRRGAAPPERGCRPSSAPSCPAWPGRGAPRPSRPARARMPPCPAARRRARRTPGACTGHPDTAATSLLAASPNRHGRGPRGRGFRRARRRAERRRAPRSRARAQALRRNRVCSFFSSIGGRVGVRGCAASRRAARAVSRAVYRGGAGLVNGVGLRPRRRRARTACVSIMGRSISGRERPSMTDMRIRCRCPMADNSRALIPSGFPRWRSAREAARRTILLDTGPRLPILFNTNKMGKQGTGGNCPRSKRLGCDKTGRALPSGLHLVGYCRVEVGRPLHGRCVAAMSGVFDGPFHSEEQASTTTR